MNPIKCPDCGHELAPSAISPGLLYACIGCGRIWSRAGLDTFGDELSYEVNWSQVAELNEVKNER